MNVTRQSNNVRRESMVLQNISGLLRKGTAVLDTSLSDKANSIDNENVYQYETTRTVRPGSEL